MTEPSQYFKGRTVQEQMNEVIGYVDTRAAEVATTAIASDVAQVHQDMLDADADAQAAAASAAAAAGTLANAVKKTGEASQSIAGDIAISGALSVSGAVTVPAPTGNTNAATKKYVDDADALKLDITAVPSVAMALTDNQTANGIKIFVQPIVGKFAVTNIGSTGGATDKWCCVGRVNQGSSKRTYFMAYAVRDNIRDAIAMFAIFNVTPSVVYQFKRGNEYMSFAITTDSDGNYDAWVNYNSPYSSVRINVIYEDDGGNFTPSNLVIPSVPVTKTTAELQAYPTFTPATYMQQVTS